MNYINKIILNETKKNIFHFKVFIICLALGVFSITLVSTISNSIFSSIQKNAATILGGEVQVSTRGTYFNKQILDWLNQNNVVFSEITEMRTMAYKKDSGDKNILVDLKSIDDNYPLFGKLKIENKNIESISTSLSENEIFVGASLLQRLNSKIGEKIFIGNNLYYIKGIIIHEPDRLTNLVSIGPRVIMTKKDLEKSKLNTAGSLVNHKINIRLINKSEKKIVNEIKNRFPTEPLRFQLASLSSQTSSQQFINQLKVILLLSAITALFLGGLGVANSINHYLAKKHKEIAILKSLGFQSSHIFTIYLAQTILMSLLGILIGYILGIISGYIILKIFPLGLAIEKKAYLDIETLILALSYGLITSLIFSLWPLAQAKDTKPSSLFRYISNSKKTIPSKFFILIVGILFASQILLTIFLFDFSLNSIFFVLGGFSLISFFYLISNLTIYLLKQSTFLKKYINVFVFTNILAPNSPSTNLITCFGIGLTLLITISMVEYNLNKEINLSIKDTAPSFFIVDIQKSQYNSLEKLITEDEDFIELNSAPSLRGRLVKVKNINIEKYRLSDDAKWLKRYDFGATFSKKLPINSFVIDGQWWSKNYSGPPLISIDKDIAENLRVKIGDTLTFNILGRDITAKIANLREVDWQSFGINFFVIFSPGILENSPFSYLATAKVTKENEVKVYKKITENFPNITIIILKEAILTIMSTLDKISNAATGISALTILVGIFVLAGAISASYDARTYDSIILKVIGASPYYIFRLFLQEFLYLGIVTSIISVVIGIILSWAITTQLIGINFSLSMFSLIYPPILGVLLVSLIGLIGTRKILRSRINTSLRIFSS
ncbi:MAG: hypothetical protein CMM18_01830 [Rhodospirillaceae bacterium]|nr:hypothetical protein [Rhodospirillaceae bacterium]